MSRPKRDEKISKSARSGARGALLLASGPCSRASTPGNNCRRRHRNSAIATFQSTRLSDVAMAAPVNPNRRMKAALAIALVIALATSNAAALRSYPVMFMTQSCEPALAASVCPSRRMRSAVAPSSTPGPNHRSKGSARAASTMAMTTTATSIHDDARATKACNAA